MENQLATIKSMPVSDIMTMAKTFAESGMFTDAKAMGQAFVKIQAGQEIGIPPFAAMSGIHIIQGKPTIGAGLIASTVKGSGKYDYKVIQLDEKACSLDFYQGATKIGNSTFTIADAKAAQTKNLEKFPKNMLFARAISNGVKWYCPDVFAGPVYTPEEMETIDVTHTEVKQTTDYTDTIKGATSKEQLEEIWNEIPKSEREQYKALMKESADHIDIASGLCEAKTIEDLESTFKSLSKENQKKYAKFTAGLKAQFQNEAA